MEYNFKSIEQKWREQWIKDQTFRVETDPSKPKCYVLDMFPYPSGAGLHVGHPLGYIASDIYSRYKRLKGFNVLHPMGFDSFGLPAEQYALETGQHPANTTEKNIDTFKKQLDKIGFCYDWSREIRTSDPSYYKWTQWIFLKLYNSYFCNTQQKARPIQDLIDKYERKGAIPADGKMIPGVHFTADDWNAFSEAEKQERLMRRRLVFSAEGEVNWCEALGTVLANDEVVNGFSERGGHPVVKKKMRQWYLRITSYADRLLKGLETVEFSESMKEMQRNWIGKSEGAEVVFNGASFDGEIKVYTTRPDTIFGVDFIVLSPEHELVNQIVQPDQRQSIDEYLNYVKTRSERERMSEVKQVTGCFTGAYVQHPFTNKQIPVWIAEYVLAGYGTGAIMAVPSGDQRDFSFATHFKIPITNILGDKFNGKEANPDYNIVLENSDFLNGLSMKEASGKVIDVLVQQGKGKRKLNYRMRDAGFSRQRYWGEPFPIVWKNGTAYPLHENELPLTLPHVESYGPGPEGEGPLANIHEWTNVDAQTKRETSTMPGYAGSSWYFLRFMDPNNGQEFCSRSASDYWNQVDVYIGGTEHAVGHLLYSRMWTKVLYDLNLIGFDEPFKKLVNQGMIQGSSRFVYRLNLNSAELLFHKILQHLSGVEFDKDVVLNGRRFDFYIPSKKLAIDITRENILKNRVKEFNALKEKFDFQAMFISEIDLFERMRAGFDTCKQWVQQMIEKGTAYQSNIIDRGPFFVSKSYIDNRDMEDVDLLHVDVSLVDGVVLDIQAFRKWRDEYVNAEFILENGQYICGSEVEKMSKSKFNTVNPDTLVEKYGADTFRMYEMFLGPLEQSKPWDTKGIEGVHRFLKKLWRLFIDNDQKVWVTDKPTRNEFKILHKTIKKIEHDTSTFNFNTAISAFMVCVNELTDEKCHKKEILEQVLILLAPYAPHISEELWQQLGNEGSILNATYPVLDEKYLQEDSKVYPVSVNGKMRTNIEISMTATQEEVQEIVLKDEVVQKWMEQKALKKLIFIPGKMINIVV